MWTRLAESSGRFIGLRVDEGLTGNEMAQITESLLSAIAECGRISLLVEIHGFRHMDPKALLEKLKFAVAHTRDIERMAIVSNKTWIKSWIQVGSPFTPVEVKHFYQSELEGAWEWLRE